jgi:hypothetical protein
VLHNDELVCNLISRTYWTPPHTTFGGEGILYTVNEQQLQLQAASREGKAYG